jgi:hypothetical protein
MGAKIIKTLFFKICCFFRFLQLWKSILYGDVSFYRCKPDGTEFLTAKEAFKIAWIVWMSDSQ